MKFLTLMTLLITINSYAGDSYLVCADLLNDEEWVLDTYFDSSSPIITNSFEDGDVIGQKIEVTFNPQTFHFVAQVYGPNGSISSKIETTLD